MIRISLGLIALLTLCGCVEQNRVIMNRKIPHQLVSDCTAEILIKKTGTTYVSQRVVIPAGWWVASPELVGD